MLFVCIMLLFLPLISANALYFHALSLFFLFLFLYERAMSSPEK